MSSGSAKPAFVPKPGQVDFTHARWAPVINCVLVYKGKILVVERSPKLNFYPGYWNGISGFLDDHMSLTEKVHAELSEELGLGAEHILRIVPSQIFDQEEQNYKKTWIVHPVLVEVDTDNVRLDWEAKNFQWIDPKSASQLKLLPGFDLVLEKLSPFL